MATVFGVERTLELAGTAQNARGFGSNVKAKWCTYEASALAAASIIEMASLQAGAVPLWFYLFTDDLNASSAATLDLGLHSRAADGTLTAIDIDCFLDAADISGQASSFTPDDAVAAIIAGTFTGAAGGIGIPMSADGVVTITINDFAATGTIGLVFLYAELP